MAGASPAILKPHSEPTWKYTSPQDLATDGIYNQENFDRLRESIMFPVQKSAFLNDIAREINGQSIDGEEGTMGKLLNENSVKKLVESTWMKVWEKLVSFGTASAEIIGILFIIQTIKTIVSLVINGYALHQVFGFSFHLLGAIWTGLTHLLISRNNQNSRNDPIDVEAARLPSTNVEQQAQQSQTSKFFEIST